MGRVATPESMAACATAGAILAIRRGSNGLGIRYSVPNFNSSPPYAPATTSFDSANAKSAIARTVASFMASLMVVAPTSNAPRKMNGKHKTLLTWFGKSERPVPIITSGRAALASGGQISGCGLASANTSGWLFICFNMSTFSTLALDKPKKMSLPATASASVRCPLSSIA